MKRFKTSWQEHGNDNDDNDNDEKADKHLNKVFAESLSNSLFQSVYEHMCRFKGRSSMKQYIKNKPIKWGFKY